VQLRMDASCGLYRLAAAKCFASASRGSIRVAFYARSLKPRWAQGGFRIDGGRIATERLLSSDEPLITLVGTADSRYNQVVRAVWSEMMRDRLLQYSVSCPSVSGPGSCELGTVRGVGRR
jgi:hypothetical protein